MPYLKCYKEEFMHVDSIAVTQQCGLNGDDANNVFVIVGLSSLEGNIWDGAIRLFSSSINLNEEEESLFSMRRSALHSVNCNAGVTKVLFAGYDNDLVLSSQDDGYVNIYSVDGLQFIQGLHAHGDIASSLSINPSNASQFLSCGWDGIINFWDWNSAGINKPLISISAAHHKHINDVAYHPVNHSVFCSGGDDGFVRIWDSRAASEVSSSSSPDCTNIFNNQQAVSCVEWSTSYPNLVYSGTDDGYIRTFDCRTGSNGGHVLPPQKIHKGRIRKIRSLPSTQIRSPESIGDVIFTASDDTTVAASALTYENDVADIVEIDRFRSHSDYVTDIAILPSIPYTIISGSTDQTVTIESRSLPSHT